MASPIHARLSEDGSVIFREWSTIVDEYLTDNGSYEDMLEYLTEKGKDLEESRRRLEVAKNYGTTYHPDLLYGWPTLHDTRWEDESLV